MKNYRQVKDQVERYHGWLIGQVTGFNDATAQQRYREQSAPQMDGVTHIETFSPFRKEQSAYQTWTPLQQVLLAVLLLLITVLVVIWGLHIATILFGLVTSLYVTLLALSAFYFYKVSRPSPQQANIQTIIAGLRNSPWPRYTILCPLYHEKSVVKQFVQGMQSLDYPKDSLQVLFLTEENDQETRDALAALKMPVQYEVLTVPAGLPQTKPRACNYGLLHATGDYVVIYDAEDIPDPLQLKKAVLTFAESDPDVVCVQAKLNIYNPYQNLLTRWFTIEYSLWFDFVLPGLQRIGFALPLGGTSNHFKASPLRALGGWDAYNVTEDCDLGLKLAQYGFRTVMVDSTTYEEANSRLGSWIRQRSRWIKGYMQTYLVHTRRPLARGRIRSLCSLQLFVGAGSLLLLINPIMWIMFLLYVVYRPVALYHELFPWYILYAGMFCFLVGNFLPLYVSMLSCIKREQYSLVKWCLSLPVCWLLASVAALLAGYELIIKPHYWHKTQHGLHLAQDGVTGQPKAGMISMPGMPKTSTISAKQVASVTERVKAITTMPMPVTPFTKKEGKKQRDPWLIATILLACTGSIASTLYFFLNHDILLYGDAYSHMYIARSVIDSITPGFGQLGGVWLPLPHLIMIPFIWNNYLWQTGLAGSIPSMISYLVTVLCLYLTAYQLTHDRACSFVGTLVFVLNPNILYLQSTPLSESICFATFSCTLYFFVQWAQHEDSRSLVLTALGCFFSSIARYDGWFLFLIIFATVGLLCWLRRYSLQRIIACLIIVGLLGSLGIVSWLVWNKIIFGDPLYFQHGVYSSQAQTSHFYASDTSAKGNILLSLKEYGYAVSDTFGLIVLFMAACGFLLLAASRHARLLDKLMMLPVVSSMAFYAFSFYSGQVNIMVPGFSPYIFNARFGTEAVLALVLFIAILAQRLQFSRAFSLFLPALLLGCILTQYALILQTGVITLEDGQFGLSCVATSAVNTYFAAHYNGGMILEDTYLGSPNEGAEVGISLSRVINQGSGANWTRALANPGAVADWVIIGTRITGDRYPIQVHTTVPSFTEQFRLVVSTPQFLLYVRRGVRLPNRPVPPQLVNPFPYCGTGKRP